MKRSDERRRDAPSVWENEGGATAPAAEREGGEAKAAHPQSEGLEKILDAAQGILSRGFSELTSIDVARHVNDHPVAAVAVAAGAGYVLGGGLLRPFATNLLRTGLRLALIPMIELLVVKALTPHGDESKAANALEERGSRSR